MPETPTSLKDLHLTRESGAELDVIAQEGGDAGVKGEVSTTIGKGWSVGAAGQWMKDAGWSVVGKFVWKGRK